MALIDRINAVITAIGTDVKSLFAQVQALQVAQPPNGILDVSVSPAQRFEATAGAALSGCSVTSIVVAHLIINDDFDADDLIDYRVEAIPNEGFIEFVISRNGPIVGNFKIAYQILSY